MKLTVGFLRRIIREESDKLREDQVDTELDHLRKNITNDLDHIDDLKDDIDSEEKEEERAHSAKRKKDETSLRRIRHVVKEKLARSRKRRINEIDFADLAADAGEALAGVGSAVLPGDMPSLGGLSPQKVAEKLMATILGDPAALLDEILGVLNLEDIIDIKILEQIMNLLPESLSLDVIVGEAGQGIIDEECFNLVPVLIPPSVNVELDEACVAEVVKGVIEKKLVGLADDVVTQIRDLIGQLVQVDVGSW